MNNDKQQQIRSEIQQLIHSIRQPDITDAMALSVLQGCTTRAKPTNMFAVIASAMLLGAILMIAFIPLINATKLFNSHRLPEVQLSQSDSSLSASNQQPNTR